MPNTNSDSGSGATVREISNETVEIYIEGTIKQVTEEVCYQITEMGMSGYEIVQSQTKPLSAESFPLILDKAKTAKEGYQIWRTQIVFHRNRDSNDR